MAGQNKKFTNRLCVRHVALGTASALALALGAGAPAFAQVADAPAQSPETAPQECAPSVDAQGTQVLPPNCAPNEPMEGSEIVSDTPADEIVVTGFRASLQSAQELKRDADTFVDVITAEDIGALADRSVAEALQRVPGVNISRFEQRDDPDRFSVEGSGVTIRGLPYVRSELNGRDIFSANGGRSLSFNDVSPELLGRVEVYKNGTADMIEGGISGNVNLVTRKPFDTKGTRIAGTVEANYGDLAEEWSPGFSILGSTQFESEMGRFGAQLGYAQSELVTRTDASQITDPCYRPETLDSGCFRIVNVGSGGFGGEPNFDETNFPPDNSVLVPKGAGVRTTDLTRDRNALSAIVQYEDPSGALLVTAEYLKAETEATLDEYAILALVNDDNFFPAPLPGTSFTYDEDGIFQTGTLTLAQGGGIATEFLRFQREDEAQTEDMALTAQWSATDRLRFNFEGQRITSDRSENGLIAAMQSSSNIEIDATGETPEVTFLPPNGGDNWFTDPSQSYYWFMIDNQVRNEGKLYSLRGDVEYDISDVGFLRKARFGARWSDRDRVTRNGNFANWGNLSAPWAGRAIYANEPGAISDFSQVRSPFDDFQRGSVGIPVPGGAGIFFGGDNLVNEYLAGVTEEQAAAIIAAGGTFVPWGPMYNRSGLVEGSVFRPGEISDVDEKTQALYGRLDFGAENLFRDGWVLDGNIGVRYVRTEVFADGVIGFPSSDGFPLNPDGSIDFETACENAEGAPGGVPGYCLLSPERLAEFESAFDQPALIDDEASSFSYWLPSFNAKLDVGNGLLFRAAVSKAIFRPDLSLYRTGGVIGDNTNNLRQEGTLESGPLFVINTGNRLLTATESWNYDLSAEWYFDTVGSLTVSLFLKQLKGIVNSGTTIRELTAPDGTVLDVQVDGPANESEGTLKGIEIAYQQVYDFLPGALGGLGSQLTYTYVDAGDFTNPDLQGNRSVLAPSLPLAGVSEHTVNAVLFYERGPISARAAYNWRSDYLQTPRDVIFPFSPIYGESTGQLDGSIFYSVTDAIKVGLQGVNLLDEVTKTSQLVDFDGTRVTRSAFRNDRRYTLIARFDF